MTTEAKSELGCPGLMAASTQSLYQENSFRVTGLLVEATPKQVARHIDKLKVLEELGQGSSTNYAFALRPSPSMDQLKEAMQRLKDPEARFIDEFFWFWPKVEGRGEDDEALKAILASDQNRAFLIWKELESDPESNYVARHNLAVMFMVTAIDWSRYQLRESVDEARSLKIKENWNSATKYWQQILGDDRVWERLRRRVRLLDDPRLTTGLVRRFAETLPYALSRVNGEVALSFWRKGEGDLAAFHLNLMKSFYSSPRDIEKTSEQILAGTFSRIKQLVRLTTHETEQKSEDCAEAVKRLIAECSPLIGELYFFYGRESLVTIELSDEVASAGNQCMVAYQIKTGDNALFVDQLRKLLPYAFSDHLRTRIQKNIGIGESNIRQKVLEPITEKLTEVLDTKLKLTAKDRLDIMKKEMMPILLTVMEKEGANSQIAVELSQTFSIAFRSISIAANNTDRDIKTAHEAIQLAAKLAKSDEQKEQIKEDIETISEALKNDNCFYCEINACDPKLAMPVKMFGEVVRKGGSVHYKYNTIQVPRCASCEAVHKKQSLTGWLILIITSYVGFAVGSMSGPNSGGWLWGSFIGFGIGFVASLIVRNSMKTKAKMQSHDNYPRIRVLRNQGWKYGEKPGKYD